MQPLSLSLWPSPLVKQDELYPKGQAAPKKLDLEALTQNLKAHEATLEEQQTEASKEILMHLRSCSAQKIAEIAINLYEQSALTSKLQAILIAQLEHALISVESDDTTHLLQLTPEQIVSTLKAFSSELHTTWIVADALQRALLNESSDGICKLQKIPPADLILIIEAFASYLDWNDDLFAALHSYLTKPVVNGDNIFLHLPPQHALVIIGLLNSKKNREAVELFTLFKNKFFLEEKPIEWPTHFRDTPAVHLSIILLFFGENSVECPSLFQAILDELLLKRDHAPCKFQEVYPFLALQVLTYCQDKGLDQAVALFEKSHLRNKNDGKFALNQFNSIELAAIFAIFSKQDIKDSELFFALQEAFLTIGEAHTSRLAEHYNKETTEKSWLIETLYFLAKNGYASPRFFAHAESLIEANYKALENTNGVALIKLAIAFSSQNQGKKELFSFIEKKILTPELLLTAHIDPIFITELAETHSGLIPQMAIAYTHFGGENAQFVAELDRALILNSESAFVAIATSKLAADKRSHVLSRLIDSGLNVKKSFANKNTALHIAVEVGLVDVVKKLIQVKVDLNWQDKSGETALHVACRLGHIPLTELLLSSGADISKKTTKEKASPFILALSSPLWEIEPSKMIAFFTHFFGNFKSVLNLLNFELKDSLLEMCLLNPQLLLADRRTERTNPFEIAFLFQSTPLAVVLASDMLESEQLAYLEALITKYPQPQVSIIAGMFLLACKNKRPSFALALINKCNTNNYRYPQGETFLHIATNAQMTAVVKRLCETGAAVNQQDQKGNTSLHNACTGGFQDIATYLLSQGADPSKENFEYKTPFTCARYSPIWKTNAKQMKRFFTEIFKNFSAITARIATQSVQDFLAYFATYPELLCDKQKNTEGANPLEVAHLFQDATLLRAIYTAMDEATFAVSFAALKAKYPQTPLDFVEFSSFDVNLAHLTKEIRVVIPKKPEGVEVDSLLALFDEVSDEFNPQDFGLNATKMTCRKYIEDEFVKTIKTKKAYSGAPTEFIRSRVKNPALDEFYTQIDNAFCHILKTFASRSPEKNTLVTNQKIQFLASCLKADPCGGALQRVAIEQYDAIVRGQAPTFEKAIYEVLSILRLMTLQSLVPPGEQNVHLYNQAFFLLAKELNLPYAETAFDDRNGRVNGMPKEETRRKFFAKLTPAAIVAFVELQLTQDGNLREKFIDFCKKNTPEEWQKKRFDEIKEGLRQLQASHATKEATQSFLQSHDILIQGNITVDAIDAVRKDEYFEVEVVEDMMAQPMKFKRKAILAELTRLEVLTPIERKSQSMETNPIETSSSWIYTSSN